MRSVVAVAHTRSFGKASIVMQQVAGQDVSSSSLQRITQDVGGELAARRDAPASSVNALAATPLVPPDLAVVECDGGRIRTREPGCGRGVHLAGKGWNETKVACLIRAQRKTFDTDPQPEPPDCFCDAAHVAKLAETEALSIASLQAEPVETADADPHDLPLPDDDWRPKRLVRTVLASMANSDTFGQQMAREAKRRRFGEAAARAFLGDGLPWNWSIWKRHFRKYTPILDFIHVLSYLFVAAKAVHPEDPQSAWDQYLVWMRGCWSGEVAQVLEELTRWQTRLGEPPADAADSDPREIVRRTHQYLKNNQTRMQYPEYRQAGLPVTTAWMESLVKEINWRVKGTEMFWNNPDGGESILQVRGAALCDDDRLPKHLLTRPGCVFTRRPKLTSFAGATRKR